MIAARRLRRVSVGAAELARLIFGGPNPMFETVFSSTFTALALLVVGAAIAWKVL